MSTTLADRVADLEDALVEISRDLEHLARVRREARFISAELRALDPTDERRGLMLMIRSLWRLLEMLAPAEAEGGVDAAAREIIAESHRVIGSLATADLDELRPGQDDPIVAK